MAPLSFTVISNTSKGRASASECALRVCPLVCTPVCKYPRMCAWPGPAPARVCTCLCWPPAQSPQVQPLPAAGCCWGVPCLPEGQGSPVVKAEPEARLWASWTAPGEGLGVCGVRTWGRSPRRVSCPSRASATLRRAGAWGLRYMATGPQGSVVLHAPTWGTGRLSLQAQRPRHHAGQGPHLTVMLSQGPGSTRSSVELE